MIQKKYVEHSHLLDLRLHHLQSFELELKIGDPLFFFHDPLIKLPQREPLLCVVVKLLTASSCPTFLHPSSHAPFLFFLHVFFPHMFQLLMVHSVNAPYSILEPTSMRIACIFPRQNSYFLLLLNT